MNIYIKNGFKHLNITLDPINNLFIFHPKKFSCTKNYGTTFVSNYLISNFDK